MGNLQRKQILAYHLFRKITKGMDLMSIPEQLPPAFRSYYEKCRKETDPMHDFVTCGLYVKYELESKMLMKDFKALYDRYREDNDIPKPARWSEKLYDSIFKEQGFKVSRPDRVTIGQIEYHREEIISGISFVEEDVTA